MKKNSLLILVISICYSCGGNIPELTVTGTDNGHDYVDMGTSVMWATCNIGASLPVEYGAYFSWAEIAPKDNYSWITYKYAVADKKNNLISLLKYNTLEKYVNVDNILQLEVTDDASTQIYGTAWHTPTKEEWQELFAKCSWKYTKLNGVNGYLVTSSNKNTLFLPLAGGKSFDEEAESAGYWGFYWSSTLCSEKPYSAWVVRLDSDEDDIADKVMTYVNRWAGRSIRPVYGNKR